MYHFGKMQVGWAVKVIIVIIISSVLFRCASATANHSVGGPTGWDLASDLRAWADANTFYAGDNLVFSYEPTHDVLEVNEADFARCRTTSPIKAYNDGQTVVLLQEGGTTRYFFCGRSRHCDMGLKLEVEVLPLPSSPNTSGTSSPLPSSPNTNGTSSPLPSSPNTNGTSSNMNPPTTPDGHHHRGTTHPPPPNSRSQSPDPDPYPGHHLPIPPPVVNSSYHECCHTSGGGVSDTTKLWIAIWLPVHARGFFLRCWLHVVAAALALVNVFF